MPSNERERLKMNCANNSKYGIREKNFCSERADRFVRIRLAVIGFARIGIGWSRRVVVVAGLCMENGIGSTKSGQLGENAIFHGNMSRQY